LVPLVRIHVKKIKRQKYKVPSMGTKIPENPSICRNLGLKYFKTKTNRWMNLGFMLKCHKLRAKYHKVSMLKTLSFLIIPKL
jgi:hypothetical protein